MAFVQARAMLEPVESTLAAQDFLRGLRSEVLTLPESGIVEVFNYGRNRQGLIPLWVGEGDMPTPSYISETAAKSFAAGETFYTYQRGIPELRRAIANYMARAYGSPFADGFVPFSPERFFVTTGGMHALQIAIRIVAGSGDEVLVPTPAWPNFFGAIIAAGASVIDLPMRFEGMGAEARWSLDLDLIARSITPRTRAIVVNSPSNPTGWIATHQDIEALLALARRHDLWIIADEIYGRFVYQGERAPSFHDAMAASDRVLFVQTFSKNWAMTGWRIGWLEAPPELGPIIENLVQYSTSGVPVPFQRGAMVALEQGEDTVALQIGRARENRDLLCDVLGRNPRISFARPEGAFYLFCRLDDVADSRALAMQLVDQAGIGVAPGAAFGSAGETFVRLCFARNRNDMVEVVRRLGNWLGGSGDR